MKVAQRRRHAGGPSPWLFDLKGTKGTAPTASTAVRFAWDRYALSALTSSSRNRCAEDATRPGISGESCAVLSVTFTDVTTLVTVPTIACALSQACSFISRPYLWSYQRR